VRVWCARNRCDLVVCVDEGEEIVRTFSNVGGVARSLYGSNVSTKMCYAVPAFKRQYV
jgi:hypothetical protein